VLLQKCAESAWFNHHHQFQTHPLAHRTSTASNESDESPSLKLRRQHTAAAATTAAAAATATATTAAVADVERLAGHNRVLEAPQLLRVAAPA
jgi:hypothetical protein